MSGGFSEDDIDFLKIASLLLQKVKTSRDAGMQLAAFALSASAKTIAVIVAMAPAVMSALMHIVIADEQAEDGAYQSRTRLDAAVAYTALILRCLRDAGSDPIKEPMLQQFQALITNLAMCSVNRDVAGQLGPRVKLRQALASTFLQAIEVIEQPLRGALLAQLALLSPGIRASFSRGDSDAVMAEVLSQLDDSENDDLLSSLHQYEAALSRALAAMGPLDPYTASVLVRKLAAKLEQTSSELGFSEDSTQESRLISILQLSPPFSPQMKLNDIAEAAHDGSLSDEYTREAHFPSVWRESYGGLDAYPSEDVLAAAFSQAERIDGVFGVEFSGVRVNEEQSLSKESESTIKDAMRRWRRCLVLSSALAFRAGQSAAEAVAEAQRIAFLPFVDLISDVRKTESSMILPIILSQFIYGLIEGSLGLDLPVLGAARPVFPGVLAAAQEEPRLDKIKVSEKALTALLDPALDLAEVSLSRAVADSLNRVDYTFMSGLLPLTSLVSSAARLAAVAQGQCCDGAAPLRQSLKRIFDTRKLTIASFFFTAWAGAAGPLSSALGFTGLCALSAWASQPLLDLLLDSSVSVLTEAASDLSQPDRGASAARVIAIIGDIMTVGALRGIQPPARPLSNSAVAIARVLAMPVGITSVIAESMLLQALRSITAAAYVAGSLVEPQVEAVAELTQKLLEEQQRESFRDKSGQDIVGETDEDDAARERVAQEALKIENDSLESIAQAFQRYSEVRRRLFEPQTIKEMLEAERIVYDDRERRRGNQVYQPPPLRPEDQYMSPETAAAFLEAQRPPPPLIPTSATVSAASAQFRRDLTPLFHYRRVLHVALSAAAYHAASASPAVRIEAIRVVSECVHALFAKPSSAMLPDHEDELALPPTTHPALAVVKVEGWMTGHTAAITSVHDTWPLLLPRFADSPQILQGALRLLTEVTRVDPRFAAFKVPQALQQVTRGAWARGQMLPCVLQALAPEKVHYLRKSVGYRGVTAVETDAITRSNLRALQEISEVASARPIAMRDTQHLSSGQLQAWREITSRQVPEFEEDSELLSGHLWADLLSLLEAAVEGEIAAPRLFPTRGDRDPGAELVLFWALLGAAPGQPKALADRAEAVVRAYTQFPRGRALIRAICTHGHLAPLIEARHTLEKAATEDSTHTLTVSERSLALTLQPRAIIVPIADSTGLQRNVTIEATALMLAPSDLITAMDDACKTAQEEHYPGFGLEPMEETLQAAELIDQLN